MESAKSLISKSEAVYVVSVAEIVSPVIWILAPAVRVFCLSPKADCKSVWSVISHWMFHHSADVCVLLITLLALMLIQVQAVYLVSVALIVLPAICILLQAVRVPCLASNASFKSAWSLSVPSILHQVALLSLAEITLLADILIPGQAE